MKLAIVAGAFNPATRAHMAIAKAAESVADRVMFAIPRSFPHKPLEGATLERRVEMLRRAGARHVEISNGGLLIEIAREVRRSHPDAEIYLACGRDTAERIIEWKYEDPRTLDRLFEEFQLLVADRHGAYQPPPHWHSRIHPIDLDEDFDHVSSTEVRRRIASGEPWQHLVPESIIQLVREIYEPR